MYILTYEINQYDQDGEYFSAAWLQKPTIEQLQAVLPNWPTDTIKHIHDGGGRLNNEYCWYNLFKYEE